ncbi:dTDP-4-dehydrorhamnose reductase [Candidatus Kuenenbacteria bacterium HGW-Kuenenbacteria-1]|uniref:dTDP-4-dehydrorhamnose reductase n=1 Tax=Candidatus Kuenenbacteria bacterium HGW-Kuenenbacteria-1 TaxID=2013812 RepID=A0A2N1UN40_9BACT|nr:MAG: dTDP-4-dehydrorhamnose reductase [Candidatus Kuenenbacteria bacterium HGW-Kuenenbacteria-1]
MKILILGSKGNLGVQLVKVFSNGNEVIGWDRAEVDITDRELILKKVNNLKPDVIINAAAYNAVDRCEESDEEYELAKKINIDGVKFLAEAAFNVKAILIHYSSDYVFSGNKENGYSEDDLPDPINRYGKTKFFGEKKIIELSGKGLKWYLIRTSKLFGPKGEKEVAKDSFFNIMLKLSKEKNELNVVDGEKSCFTYTPDLAFATKNLLEINKKYGIYHLTNLGSCTWYEGVVELFKLKNINIKVNRINSDDLKRPAKRPQNSVLLNTKLPKLRDYKEALEEYLKI